MSPGEPDGATPDALLHPLHRPSKAWWAGFALATGLVIAAALAYHRQLTQGLQVTGLNQTSQWGIYLANYVFWIGVSKGGTLISALLRLTRSGWRRPVTRCAEAITVFAMLIGPLFAILHTGQPAYFWRCLPILGPQGLWPNFRSPIIWDVVALTTYLVGSVVYLWLPLIPDAAQLRDRSAGWRRALYRCVAVGWTGEPRQWAALEAAIRVMAVVVLCVAVSVHTVVSFIFGLSTVPGWHSTIFGPMFVMGAMYSGLAAVIVAMVVLRRTLGLQAYITHAQFEPLGKILLALSLIWAWFVGSEMLTVWYGGGAAERAVLDLRTAGVHGDAFALMVVCNLVIPLALLSWRRVRSSPAAMAGVGLAILVGMYLERMHIVAPPLEAPRMLGATAPAYVPSAVELTVSLGTLGAFVALYLVFVRLFPVVSIWEWRGDPASPPADPHRPAKTLGRAACGGATVGGGLAASIAWIASHSWPIAAGGMPGFSPWTTSVVVFEGAMLGAIVATLGAFLVQAATKRGDP